MKKMLLAAIAAAGLVSGCATSDGLIDRPMVSGTNAGLFDTDGDGMFEQAEYTAFGDDNFGVWDSNDDGWIDDNEFGVGFDNVGWDNDSDGILDDDEWGV